MSKFQTIDLEQMETVTGGQAQTPWGQKAGQWGQWAGNKVSPTVGNWGKWGGEQAGDWAHNQVHQIPGAIKN